jgi:molybdopterin-guanine dinucleotide biosynthesis protein A
MTGIVLAGGRSRRMGQDKALLPAGRSTLVEFALARLRPHVDALAVMASAANAAAIRQLTAEPVLVDAVPEQGPLMAVWTGLDQARDGSCLFLPCDMPWVDGRLLDRLKAFPGGAVALGSVLPGGDVQPFPLLCRASAQVLVGRLLDRGERSLRALLREPGAALMPVSEPELARCFANVNEPGEYARFLEETSLAR